MRLFDIDVMAPMRHPIIPLILDQLFYRRFDALGIELGQDIARFLTYGFFGHPKIHRNFRVRATRNKKRYYLALFGAQIRRLFHQNHALFMVKAPLSSSISVDTSI